MNFGNNNNHSNIDLSTCFRVLTHPVRLNIYKFILNSGDKVKFSIIEKNISSNSKLSSSTISSHLKSLKKIGLIANESKRYFITTLGKGLAEHILSMEKLFLQINQKLMVRTSQFNLEPFDESKIVDVLFEEGRMSKIDAQKIASLAKNRLISSNLEYITSPLIREFVNAILLENKYEDVRHRLTRLGLPPTDISKKLEDSGFSNIDDFYRELGKNVFEQNFLLNLIPLGFADFFLSGRIFFLHPENWGLIPSELVLSGIKFSEVVIKSINRTSKEIDTKTNNTEFLPFALSKFFENSRYFFSSGLILTEFNQCIERFSEFFDLPITNIINDFFTYLPDVNIAESYDSRNFHDDNWELWLEILINKNDLDSNNVIKGIIENYMLDVEGLNCEIKTEQDNIKQNHTIRRISKKPNLLINLDQTIVDLIQETKNFSTLPILIQKIMLIGIFHNVNFGIPNSTSKKEKKIKKILTPKLVPVSIVKHAFANQSITPRPTVVLDKIFVNLPKIIQISENLSEFPVNDKNSPKLKDKSKFLKTLQGWIFNLMNIFEEKFSLVSKNIKKFKDWKSFSDSIFEREFLSDNKEISGYSGKVNIICSVSLNGLSETVRYFTGLLPDENNNSFEFLNEILDYVNKVLKNNSKKTNIQYVLSQPHLDNYLQVHFIQDLNIMQSLSSQFLNINKNEYNNEIESIRDIKRLENKNFKNYSITNFMKNNPNNKKLSDVHPYWVSIFKSDSEAFLDKNLDLFKSYQESFGNGAYFNLNNPFKNDSVNYDELLTIYQKILESNKKFFGFSNSIVNTKGLKYYRYGGCYKPLAYYGKLIRDYVIKTMEN